MQPTVVSSAAMGISAAITLTLSPPCAAGTWLVSHPEVTGAEIADAEVRPQAGPWTPTAWDDLTHTLLEPGRYEVRLRAVSDKPGEAIQIPVCAGRIAVRVDARAVSDGPGPIVVPVAAGAHDVVITVNVSRYERRIACGERVRVGYAEETTSSGLGLLVFESPHDTRGGGKAVVYVPPGHDLHQLGQVLVGLHPWNGSIWTYAAYQELLGEARARGVLLLMPSGLGNTLYTADAEDEVMRAMDALESVVVRPVFPRAPDQVHGLNVSIWGASMGGAGATTIAFHHPDRFATVSSFFGDSSYDLSTYVRAILPDQRAAHQVNALDVVDNARYLPVRLIHGEDDVTSPIRQSEILADALKQRGYAVRFDRVPGIGHAGALVARYVREIVDAAATTPTARMPLRITYRSVRPSDDGAYGITIKRQSLTTDAFIDLERQQDGIHVLHADGVRQIGIRGRAIASSCQKALPVVFDDPAATVPVVWTGTECL
jgi:enterochelin esterase-like enzyme